LGGNLPICEAQEFLQPECTNVHEDCKNLQQQSRWVSLHPNTILIFVLRIYNIQTNPKM
jgi:hypothetical protein